MSLSQLEQIEHSIKQAKPVVEFGNCLERLKSNKDFKKVFLEGYFEQEAIRLVHLKADPSQQSAEKQQAIIAQMDAIGAVSAYLNTALHLARMANRQIESDEQAREELISEEASND